jgi:hypothetical protein
MIEKKKKKLSHKKRKKNVKERKIKENAKYGDRDNDKEKKNI